MAIIAVFILPVASKASQAAIEPKPIGEVVHGPDAANVTNANGETRDLEECSKLFVGDAVESTEGSELVLKFADGTTAALISSASRTVEEYSYLPPPGVNTMKLLYEYGLAHIWFGDLGDVNVVVLETPTMLVTSPSDYIVVQVIGDKVELTVKLGTATAQYRRGGAAVDLIAGETAISTTDEASLHVLQGISDSASGEFPNQPKTMHHCDW